MNVFTAKHLNTLALPAMLALAACSHSQGEAPPKDALAQAQAAADAGRAARAKAEADGILAAQGLAALHGRSAAPDPGLLGQPDAQGYAELDWNHMVPKEDIPLLQKAPPVVHIGNHAGAQFGTLHTVAALDGRKVRLTGYVVPLETDGSGGMTEFFFVPYYGACIHVPPPPPNMLVHVHLARAVPTPQIWDPFWLRGVLRIHAERNAVAASAYAMEPAELVKYSDQDDAAGAFE
jgi:hypothetical protein